ncbi:unnamed protein product, partial [Choristocarpus tenellus]
EREEWILDSAASCHVTNMITHMTNYKPCIGHERVVTASQNSFCIAGHGDLIILFPSRDNKEVEILLQNVAHVPNLGFNLFSCQAAADKGAKGIFTVSTFSLFDGRATLSIGGKQYTMIIRDDYSRFVWLYFLRAKSDAAEAFKKYLVM